MMYRPTPEMLELEDQSATLRLTIRQAGQRLRHDFSGGSDQARGKPGVLASALSMLKTLPATRSISAMSVVLASAWIQARLNRSTMPGATAARTHTGDAGKNTARSRNRMGSLGAAIVGIIGVSAGIGLAKLIPVSSLERSILTENKPDLVGLVDGMVDQSLNSAKQSLVEAFGLSKLIATVMVLFGMAASFKSE